MRFSIALRNTFRNHRRTLLNVAMIAGGVSGVILFKGFASRVLYDLREITIHSRTGHLQLAKKGYWEKNMGAKETLLEDYEKLSTELRRMPNVRYAAGRISFFGLLSSDDQSYSARGISLDPSTEKDKNESFALTSGHHLSPESPFEIMVGSGLAKRLQLHAGGNVTVLTYTYDGVVNALDLQVGGIFHTQVSEVDDTTFLIPLKAAQRLLDTEKVEQIVVGLDNTDKTNEVLARVRGILPEGGKDSVIAKSWLELAGYYLQCVSFFSTQNAVFELIILSIVLLGVLNTIGMSVFERMGEIGTIQALGETRKTVLYQFLLEGAILGTVGSLAGVLAGTLLAGILNAVKLPMVVPGASTPLVVHIDLFASSYAQAVVLAVLASTLAALIPALRASRMNIVESLRHYV